MFGTYKIVWKEGLFLQPQHFQQLERSLVSTFNRKCNYYFPYDYGFVFLKIDIDAIANGTFSVIQAQGILPDGTVFDIPKYDPKPSSRTFYEYINHDQQSLDVYIGVPQVVENKPNITDEKDSRQLTRYQSQTISIIDEVSGRIKKDIEIGSLNYRILFGTESRDDFSTMQIARLKRDSNGQVIFDDSFVPPLLQLSASNTLLDQLSSLLELLMAKISAFSQSRRQIQGGYAEFSETEQQAYRILHTINTFTPMINHYRNIPTDHPYEIFKTVSSLAGALCTFSAEVSIVNLPTYDHTNISTTFTLLDMIVRKILGASISVACVSLPIEDLGTAKYLCRVKDQTLFSTGNFYIGISAEIPVRELVVHTLSRIKMCSREKLELIIPTAMPGLTLIHVQQPPKDLSTKPGFTYFKIDQHGDFWEGIKASGTLSFYFPHQFKKFSMEILVLKR